MPDKKVTYEILDILRGDFSPNNYDEVLTTASLLMYLNNHRSYEEIVNLPKILRAGAKAKKVFDQVLKEIEGNIPYFKGVFQQLPALEKLQSSLITQVFYELNRNITTNKISEFLETALEIIAINQGRRGGESATPSSINKLAINILNPSTGSFYDGSSGYGGSLLTAKKHAKKDKLNLYGQEINGKTWAISKIRLFIAGSEKNKIKLGNALTNPQFITGNELETFNYVFMDLPFSVRLDNYEKLKDDPYNQFHYGLPSRSTGDFAFISHGLAALKETGRAAFIVPHGILFRSGQDGKIRENMITSDIIEAVISLPTGLYTNTSIPVNLIIFNKNKQHRNKILFIEAKDLFVEEGRTHKQLSDEHIEKITQVIQTTEEIPEFSKLVHNKDLENGILTVNRYILPKKLKIDGYGLVSFKEEAIKKLETVPLKDLATFFRGYNVVSSDEEHPEGKYKIIRLSDVNDGKINLANAARYDIRNNAKISMYELKEGDVILAIRGQILKSATIPASEENLLLSQNFIGIRCRDSLNPDYLHMFLESPLGQYMLTNKLSGTAIMTIRPRDVEALEIPYLPVQRQKEIIDVLRQRESEIEREIVRLKEALLDSKLSAFHQMGIDQVFSLEE